MIDFIVYSKPNCHACEDMKAALEAKGYTFDVVDMMNLPKEQIASLRTWARAEKQMSMPIVRDVGSTLLITNEKIYKILGE